MTASGMAMVPMCSKVPKQLWKWEQMDKSARNTQFKDVAHMDGLHLWAKGLITLALWVTNPASLITHHLACMDCESENTENVALFLKLK